MTTIAQPIASASQRNLLKGSPCPAPVVNQQ
jgi:hypothetical protein